MFLITPFIQRTKKIKHLFTTFLIIKQSFPSLCFSLSQLNIYIATVQSYESLQLKWREKIIYNTANLDNGYTIV